MQIKDMNKEQLIADIMETLERVVKESDVRTEKISDRIDDTVQALCECYGYGAVMDSASRQWRLKLRPQGIECGAFVAGPCIGTLRSFVERYKELTNE